MTAALKSYFSFGMSCCCDIPRLPSRVTEDRDTSAGCDAAGISSHDDKSAWSVTFLVPSTTGTTTATRGPKNVPVLTATLCR